MEAIDRQTKVLETFIFCHVTSSAAVPGKCYMNAILSILAVNVFHGRQRLNARTSLTIQTGGALVSPSPAPSVACFLICPLIRCCALLTSTSLMLSLSTPNKPILRTTRISALGLVISLYRICQWKSYCFVAGYLIVCSLSLN